MALDALRPRLERRFGTVVPVTAGAGTRTEPGFSPAVPEVVEAAALQEDEEPEHATVKTGHIVLVGYGRVGAVVADALSERQASFVVVEDAEGRVNAARDKGFEVIVGNAAGVRVLNLANVDMAATVVIAIPNAFEAGQAVEQARKSNPKALIVARAHSDEEEGHLKTLGADVVILGEREIALGMVDVISRDSSAIAEITAADAVASALGPLAAAATERKLAADPNLLAEAIEATHIQHADTGPAEPPYVVSSLGEEPDPEPLAEVEVEAEQPTSELVEMTPEQRLAPLVPSGPRPAPAGHQAGRPVQP
jgi:CPA2 family monovalent cation:H+ antiporter-2